MLVPATPVTRTSHHAHPLRNRTYRASQARTSHTSHITHHTSHTRRRYTTMSDITSNVRDVLTSHTRSRVDTHAPDTRTSLLIADPHESRVLPVSKASARDVLSLARRCAQPLFMRLFARCEGGPGIPFVTRMLLTSLPLIGPFWS